MPGLPEGVAHVILYARVLDDGEGPAPAGPATAGPGHARVVAAPLQQLLLVGVVGGRCYLTLVSYCLEEGGLVRSEAVLHRKICVFLISVLSLSFKSFVLQTLFPMSNYRCRNCTICLYLR